MERKKETKEVLEKFDFNQISYESKRTCVDNSNIYLTTEIYSNETPNENWTFSIDKRRTENLEIFYLESIGIIKLKKHLDRNLLIESRNKFFLRKRKTIDYYHVKVSEELLINTKFEELLNYFLDSYISISFNKEVKFRLLKEKEINEKEIVNLYKVLNLIIH